MAPPIDVRAAAFPDKVDLREFLWPVENLGSVVAGAAASAAIALEYHLNKRMGEKQTNLSTLFIHYNARRLSGEQDKNVGTTMSAVMEAIRTYGACTEATWPFDPARVTISPPPQAYEEAKKFAGQRTANPADVLQALAVSYPVPFLVRIPARCLEEAGRTQVMPALTEEERQKIKEHPGQAMVVVGYDQADKTFLARHFLGDKWGDRGHCRIPFDVFWSLVIKGSADAWFIDKPKVEKTEDAVLAVAPAAAVAVRDDIVTGVIPVAAARATNVQAAAFPDKTFDVHAAAVPDKVDMREYLWPIENVGEIPAAAAAAAAAALEYHCNRIGEAPTNLSTLFIHYNARRLSGEQNTRGGTTMDAVMEAITAFGACREETWPLDPAKLTTKPPAQAYEEAKKFAGIRCQHPQDLLESLSLYYPTPFVARIPTRCLSEAERTGKLPPLTAEEQRQPTDHPVHAMVLVGYDKTARTLLARNCFGDKWGEKGHCHIPFDVMDMLAPPVSRSRWLIAKPDTTAAVNIAAVAAPSAAFVAPAAAAAASAEPDTLASMAAKMRSEIRESLQRDIADATKRIKDR